MSRRDLVGRPSEIPSGNDESRDGACYFRVPHLQKLSTSLSPFFPVQDWLQDVVAHCENEIEIKFPIIGDSDRSISTKYGMIDPGTSDEQSLPLTIREFICLCKNNSALCCGI